MALPCTILGPKRPQIIILDDWITHTRRYSDTFIVLTCIKYILTCNGPCTMYMTAQAKILKDHGF